MFELVRKEPDGSTTLIRYFTDDAVSEALPFAYSLESEDLMTTFRRKALDMGLAANLEVLYKEGIECCNGVEEGSDAWKKSVARGAEIIRKDLALRAVMDLCILKCRAEVVRKYVIQRVG